MPTRIGTTSCTLIDNIYCRLSNNSIDASSGIIYSAISDHFPYFTSFQLNDKKSKSPPKKVKRTIDTQKAAESCITDLSNVDFKILLEQNLDTEPNTNYNIFIDTISDIKEKHFPRQYVKYNKHKHKNNKWITSGIIKSISKRDNMHLKLKQLSPDSAEYRILKMKKDECNFILKKTIREAKFKYYTELFEQYKFDIKKTWQNISKILNKSSRNKNEIKQIKLHGKNLTDKSEIADAFNNFFVQIGPELSEKIDTQNKKPYTAYLNKSITSTFNFSLMDEGSTMKILQSLKNKTSSGHDGISLKFLKTIAPLVLLVSHAIFGHF